MLYLASRSPRRRQLLESVGLEFSVLDAEVREYPRDGEAAEQSVQRLAGEKAAAGVAAMERDRLAVYPVLAADTVVVVDDRVMGKPESADRGRAMLELLSGRTHRVLTAIALHVEGDAVRYASSESLVTMKHLARWEIDRYWQSGEPADKAGGYAIQGLGSGFVSGIQGSYSGVVGLPMFELRELLTSIGIDWL